MGATTNEGTGNGSAAKVKPLIINGSVKTVNIESNAVTAAKLDKSHLAGFVLSTATVTLDSSHANRPLILDRAAGVVVTLPAATGTGDTYKFYVKTTVTTNEYQIESYTNSDDMIGVAFGSDDETPLTGTPKAIDMWIAAANQDMFRMNGTTQGGIKGDFVEFIDMADGLFHVKAVITQSGTEVTPFDQD
jgi:hypothetical protein